MTALERQNPWWRGEESYILSQWRRRRIRWIPSWLDEIVLEPYSLNLVIGPRQVGKTTGLHLLVERLLRGGIDPLQILFMDLDLMWNLDLFRKTIDEYMGMRKQEGYDSSFILIDEVTSLEGWWRLIKGYVDVGVFENDVLVLTGSSSLRLRGEVELFPGRMGRGVEVEALPLSFREFLRVKGVEIKRTGDLEGDMARLLPIRGRLRELFREYMEVGGFPLSINRNPAAEESFLRSIIGELLRLGRSPSLTAGILGSLMRKAPSPVSYSSIGTDVGLSYKTVRDYLELLMGLMILGEAPFSEAGVVKWRKERKYFFRDPFIARVLAEWTGVSFLPSALYEWVVQEHLYRRFGHIHYWRNGYEVDILADGMKVEVKLGKPHKRYPKDVLIIDEDNVAEFLAVIV